jgi:hypothetical protein
VLDDDGRMILPIFWLWTGVGAKAVVVDAKMAVASAYLEKVFMMLVVDDE